jgi:hypothetical protein
MDDVPLCPPYWSEIIWWLIHHHGPGPDPGPLDRELVAQYDAHFAALAISALASRLSDQKVAQQIGTLTSKLSSTPMPGLSAVGAGR